MRLQIFIFYLITSFSFAQVGINTSNPDGMLDLTSTTQGILLPRVELVITSQELPITNPLGGTLEDGTWVYNTATINDVTPGYYYWETDRWNQLTSAPEIFRFTTVTLPIPAGTNEDADFLLDTTNYSYSVFRIIHSGGILGGITNGIHGRVIYLYNGHSNKDLKLLSQSNSGSSAQNKFSADSDIILKPGNSIIIFYDGLYLNQWIVAVSNN